MTLDGTKQTQKGPNAWRTSESCIWAGSRWKAALCRFFRPGVQVEFYLGLRRISLHPKTMLSAARGAARLQFTVSAESLDFDGDALFEIFERNRGRVSWRARFYSATPMTPPLTVQANDYKFESKLSYSVVVRAQAAVAYRMRCLPCQSPSARLAPEHGRR